MAPKDRRPSAAELRRRAEALASARPVAAPLTEDAVRRSLHELQVHQIELQMQNEALQQSEAEAHDAVRRLAELNESVEAKIVERTAELVVAREAAEAANRVKSAFLSNMAHELRTPMNGLIGMVDLSLMRATDAQQRSWLGMARSSAGQLMAVINDILDISKLEAEPLEIEPVAFGLGELLGSLNALLAPEVSQRGLAFHVDICPTLSNRCLVGDAGRLRQVLLKLAGNAVKFTEEGGVRIDVRVDAETELGPTVRFAVHDTGIGIATHHQDRLFRAFGQVDDTLSRHYAGVGLGLAICTHLVRLMHGQIGLESALGTGSTFWFTVPLANAVAR